MYNINNTNMVRNAVSSLVIAFIFLCTAAQIPAQESPADFVNTFIGTNNAGNTFPGAVLPWGMASVSPHNCLNFDSGDNTQTGIYIHGQPHIYGFGNIHYSGVGCNLGGNIILMPQPGKLNINPAKNRSGYSGEKSEPGYYEVQLTDYDIFAQLTATKRCGLSKFTFQDEKGNVTLDLSHPVNGVWGGYINLVSDNEMEGYEKDGGFCGSRLNYNVYWVVRFNKKASNYGLYNNGEIIDATSVNDKNVGAFYSFNFDEDKELMAKVGISYVSIEQARKNLDAEIPEFSFDEIKTAAKTEWNKQLEVIEVEGGTANEKTIFYTALYHSLLLPYVSNDVDGKFRSFVTNDSRILPFSERPKTNGASNPFEILETNSTRYSMFSLWDTYRTLHPLLTLAYPRQQTDIVNTFIDKYKESGALPLWSSNGIEWGGMVGDPASIVIADTYLKNYTGFDLKTALKAVKDNGRSPSEGGNNFRRGHDEYARLGYIPEDKKAELGVWGTVSTAMEYSLADFAVAKMAEKMGDKKFAREMMQKSRGPLQLYDPDTMFFRPKLSDGSWMKPFDVYSTAGEVPGHGHLGYPGYVEGNAWQYLFFMRHFPNEMSRLMGGKEMFIKRLDECFEKDQFVLWNEPDMHYPFIYSGFEGEEWKTQKEVTKALKKHFNTGPGGLPGNDDAGTISAWVVFAMMGIYPDAQGLTDYLVFRPAFDKVTVNLKQGNTLKIINNPHKENEYIKEIFLNGKKVNGFKIDHNKIAGGGTIEIKY